MFEWLSTRGTRRYLVVEINPFQILVMGIRRPRRGPVTIEFTGEFERDDTETLRRWIDGRKDFRKRWLPVIGGFVTAYGVILRESLRSKDLESPEQLVLTIRDHQQRHSSSSSVPMSEFTADRWTFRAVDTGQGRVLPDDNFVRPALLVGVSNRELHQVQQQLLDCELLPQQLEPALLPLFGAIYQIMEKRHQTRASVVVVLRQETTTIYIMGKEGVHTPGLVAHGMSTILAQTRKEFALETDEAALARLKNPDDQVRRNAPRLVRSLGASLRPLINSYEMTTGQPIAEVYCAYLPPALAWLAEPFVRAIGHEPMTIDCQEWMPLAGLEPAGELPPFAPHWLGALSLAGNLPGSTATENEPTSGRGNTLDRSWHVDCRRTLEPQRPRLLRTRFVGGIAAAAVMACALAACAWQWYVMRDLRADTQYWDEQLASNRPLVESLTAALTTLETRTARVQQAHALMRQPYQMTDFLMELGRTLPPRLRIDRVEGSDGSVIITGSALEQAEEASLALGRYREILRQSPIIGPLCSSITATSLQRERDANALRFEITLRLKAATP
jgi:hypothetical protein